MLQLQTGEGSIAVPTITVDGFGSLLRTYQGSGNLTLPSVEVEGVGSIGRVGSGAIVLPSLEVNGVGTTTPELNNLLAWWDLEGTGGNWVDSHTGGYTLTPQGTVSSVAGKIGNAFQMAGDGSNSRIQSTDSAFNFGDVPVYMAHWYYPQSLVGADAPNFGQIYAGRYETTGNQRAYEFNNRRNLDNTANIVGVLVSANGSSFTLLRHTLTLSLDTWYFVEFYHDPVADLIGIAVNNSEFVTASHSGGFFVGSTAPFRIGHRTDGLSDWAARVDAFKIYTALPADLSPSGALRSALWNNGNGISYPG